MVLHGTGFRRLVTLHRALLHSRVRPGAVIMLMVLMVFVSSFFVEMLPFLGTEMFQLRRGGSGHVHTARAQLRHHVLSRRAVRIIARSAVLTRLTPLVEATATTTATTTTAATGPAGFTLVFAALGLLSRALVLILTLTLDHGLLLIVDDLFCRCRSLRLRSLRALLCGRTRLLLLGTLLSLAAAVAVIPVTALAAAVIAILTRLLAAPIVTFTT